MNNSYESVYRSYAEYGKRIGSPVLPFEDWMVAREGIKPKSDEAQNFLKANSFAEVDLKIDMLYGE